MKRLCKILGVVIILGALILPLLPIRVFAAPADAYWVGGSGAWTDATNHWAITDGGAPGAGNTPDSTSNVWFTANSDTGAGFAVSISGNVSFKDMNWSGVDVIPTLSVTNFNTLSCYGDMTLKSTLTADASASGVTFNSAGSHTITTNGGSFSGFTGATTFTGGGTWTLQDSWVSSYMGFTVQGGGSTLDTNDKTVNVSTFQADAGSVVDLSNTILNTNSWFTSTGTVTLTGSTINLLSSTTAFTNGIARTFNNVTYVGGATLAVTGANTYANFTYTGANSATNGLTFAANQVITGTLTLTGYNSSTKRLSVGSSVVGTQRQITAGTVAITNCNISDLAGVGAADWDISAGMNSDLGNNLGITFTTAQNNFWVGNSGNVSDITHWASTTGGVGGTGRIPLIQDTGIFDANSFSIPGRTVTIDITNLGGIDTNGAVANGYIPTSVTNSPTFSSAAQVDIYGAFNFGGATWTNASGGTWFKGQNTIGVTGTGVYTFTSDVYISTNSTYMTSVNFTTAFTIVGTVYLRSGVLCLQGFNVTATKFDSSTTTQVRALNLATGTFTLNDTAAVTKWNVSATNMSVYAGTSTIVLTNSGANGQTFTGGTGIVYYNLTITGAGDYTTTFGSSNTFNQVLIDRSVAHKTIAGNYTLTVTAGLFIPTNGVVTVSISNVDISKSSGAVVLNYLAFTSGDNTCVASGGATFYAGVNSTGSPQTGWNFTSPALPAITTSAAVNVTSSTAELNGNLTSLGGYGTVYVYFQYGVDNTFATYASTSPKTTKTVTGTYAFVVTGLSAPTTYYFRSVASDGYNDLATGTTLSFLTGQPSVTTVSATEITQISVTLNGNLISLGSYTDVFVYFEYGLTIGMTLSTTPDSKTILGAFSSSSLGLVSGRTYNYRAVVSYGAGLKSYGSTLTFDSGANAKPTAPATSSSIKLGAGQTYVTRLGPTVAGWFDSAGTLFGTDGVGFGGGLTFVICLAIMLFLSAKGYPIAGLSIGLPIQLASAYIGLWQWAFVGVIIFILALAGVKKMWIDR